MLENFKKVKGRLPEGYVDPPRLGIKEAQYLEAFYDICRSRMLLSEGQPAPLTLGNIKEYVDFYGPMPDMDEFTEVVFQLDAIYVDDLYKKIKLERTKARAKEKTSNKAPPRRR